MGTWMVNPYTKWGHEWWKRIHLEWHKLWNLVPLMRTEIMKTHTFRGTQMVYFIGAQRVKKSAIKINTIILMILPFSLLNKKIFYQSISTSNIEMWQDIVTRLAYQFILSYLIMQLWINITTLKRKEIAQLKQEKAHIWLKADISHHAVRWLAYFTGTGLLQLRWGWLGGWWTVPLGSDSSMKRFEGSCYDMWHHSTARPF